MSKPNSRGVKTADKDDERNSLSGEAMEDVNNVDSSPDIPVTSEEVAEQVRGVSAPLSKVLELLYDLIYDLEQSFLRRNEETSGLTQRPLRAHQHYF